MSSKNIYHAVGDRTPYTYRIQCISTGKYYYGVRYAKGCHPSDLWQTYFTSSKYIREEIENYGKADFRVEIRRIFTSVETAIAWESQVNAYTMHWDNYYNDQNGSSFHPSICGKGIASFWKNATEEKRTKRKEISRLSGKRIAQWRIDNDMPVSKEQCSAAGKIGGSKLSTSGRFQTDDWKIQAAKSGGNTQWTTNGAKNKRIKVDAVDEFLKNNISWRLGVVRPANSVIKVGKPVQVNDITYLSMRIAKKDLGISEPTLIKRCRSEKFPNYKFVTRCLIESTEQDAT